jgi:hypothetical protein
MKTDEPAADIIICSTRASRKGSSFNTTKLVEGLQHIIQPGGSLRFRRRERIQELVYARVG